MFQDQQIQLGQQGDLEILQIEEKLDSQDYQHNPYVILTLKIQYNTQVGQGIYIVGSNDKLGNWDTNKAVRMKCSSMEFNKPYWSVSLIFNQQQLCNFQYKYFVGKYNGGELSQWESCNNREASLQGQFNHYIIMDSWNDNHGQIVKYREEEHECPICILPFQDYNISLNMGCFHILCQKCHTQMVSSYKGLGCPFCRCKIEKAQVIGV